MKRLWIVLPILTALVVSPLVHAEGTSLSDEALNTIRTNCVTAQVAIQNLQQSEKTTRINRGYVYENILKLMADFNSRVAQNKIGLPDLLMTTSDYQQEIRSFVDAYAKYDDSIKTLISMNCRENPSKFYSNLSDARMLRNAIERNVVQIDALLNRYQTSIDAVKKLTEGVV